MKNKWICAALCCGAVVLLFGCSGQTSSAVSSPAASSSASSTPPPSSTAPSSSQSSSALLSPASTPAPVQASSDGDVMEISEKMFLSQINDIYFNFDLYEDKTIVVEGMYNNFYALDGVTQFPVVYRRGPGCCGNDGWGGFYLRYEGEAPQTDQWIRVTGKPVMENDDKGYPMLFLHVTSIEPMEEPGAEFVAQ